MKKKKKKVQIYRLPLITSKNFEVPRKQESKFYTFGTDVMPKKEKKQKKKKEEDITRLLPKKIRTSLVCRSGLSPILNEVK